MILEKYGVFIEGIMRGGGLFYVNFESSASGGRLIFNDRCVDMSGNSAVKIFLIITINGLQVRICLLVWFRRCKTPCIRRLPASVKPLSSAEGRRLIFTHLQYGDLIGCSHADHVRANRKPDRKSASVRMKVGWFD